MRAREDLARVVEHHRVPVEDELVLPADEVAEREIRARVARARHEHLLALLRLADVEGRCGEVDDELRSGERQVGRRRARLPQVLADRGPEVHVAHPNQQEVASLGEVPMLVEDAVVREEMLPVDGLDAAVRADRAGVREVAVEPGRADERDDARRRRRDLLERLVRCPDEAGAKQEVLGWIARGRKLRVHDEVRARCARVCEAPRIFERFPSRSPTTTLICASASLRFSPHSHKPSLKTR